MLPSGQHAYFRDFGEPFAYASRLPGVHISVQFIRITFTPGAALELRIKAENVIKESQH